MDHSFPFSDSNKRYHTLDYFYKKKFQSKIAKVSLNAGFTCPNRDGSKGLGGCVYCSPSLSGDYAGDIKEDILSQFHSIQSVMKQKWKDAKWIGYFQAGSNTYAPVEQLKAVYEPVLEQDDVVGLNIATRPDAITKECLTYLEDLNKRTYLTIELGLQTIHEKTATYINRCHDLSCLEEMVNKLRERKISVVIHIIDGLPYETKEEMLETVRYVNKLDIQGIKIHMMHVLKHTALENKYKEETFPILRKEEYVDIVTEQLALLRPEIVIHRLTGDPKVEDLIEPFWLVKKVCVLNDIDKEMKRKNLIQGCKIKD